MSRGLRRIGVDFILHLTLHLVTKLCKRMIKLNGLTDENNLINHTYTLFV